MQWSKTVAVLQLCATGVLIWKVWTLGPAPATNSSHPSMSLTSGESSFMPQGVGNNDRPAAVSHTSANDSIEAAEIRRIIREELAVATHERRTLNGSSGSPPEPRYDEAFQERMEQVSARLDTVLSAGRIGNADMERLHAEIGSLHPKDRRMLLSRLAKAINAGTVKVTL